MHAVFVVGVLAALMTGITGEKALFPSASTNLNGAGVFLKPISSTATCRSTNYCPAGSSVGSDDCLVCNGDCPHGVDSDIDRDEFTLIGQPECKCPTNYPVLRNSSHCCVSNNSSSCALRLSEDARYPALANDNSAATYFQSAKDVASVNVTIDLLISQEILNIDVTFEGRVPYAMMLLRSKDGVTYHPYEYYAPDCTVYGLANNGAIAQVNQSICNTQLSSPRKTSITFSALSASRIAAAGPGQSYETSMALQDYTRARYVRLAMRQYYTSATATDPFGSPLPTEPFYRISNIEVFSRVDCNGHSNIVLKDDAQPTADMAFGGYQALRCDCQHNTQGSSCQMCKPLYNGKPWQRGINAATPNICVKCECNKHSDACVYDASLDSNPTSATNGNGGRCTNCQHNTMGAQCDQCMPGYYRNPGVAIDSPDACIPCGCFIGGTVNSTTVCDAITGQCPCQLQARGRNCSECQSNFYGLATSTSNSCQPCGCSTTGTLPTALSECNQRTGQCACKPGATGRACDGQCETGFFRATRAPVGVCTPCDEDCSSCFGAGANECTSCFNVRALDGSCRETCPVGSYNDSNTCKQCHPQCGPQGCSGPGADDCVSCSNYQDANGTCIQACPSEHYNPLSNTRLCLPCHPECSSCTGPNATDCSVCKRFKDVSTCVPLCPAIKYGDTSRTCRACHPQCDSSFGCTNSGANSCNKCQGVFDVVTQECSDVCSPLHYSDNSDIDQPHPICTPCSSTCANGCTGPSASECLGNCTVVKYDGVCLTACPSHTYRSGKSCLDCHPACSTDEGCFGPGSHQCNDCKNGTFEFNNGTCVLACPQGTYADTARRCQPCNSNCVSCAGPAASQCNSCKQLVQGATCVASCPADTFQRTRDNEDIGSGQASFGDDLQSPQECINCHPECLGCDGETAADCLVCRNFRYNGMCYPSCPNMTAPVFSTLQNSCLDCSPQCMGGCSTGNDPSACNSCRNVINDGTCVASCPADRYQQGLECFSCHPQCSTETPGCRGPSNLQCQRCRNFEVEATGECVQSCPFGTYNDKGVCKACDERCDGCTGSSPARCLTCKTYKFDETCVDSCPTGTALEANTTSCKLCHPQCTGDCFGLAPDQCLASSPSSSACRNFEYEAPSGSLCVGACDLSSTYATPATKMCNDCHPMCAPGGCVGAGPDQCQACLHFNFSGTCVKECPLNTYVDNDFNCQPCDSECTAPTGLRQCGGPDPGACYACTHVVDNSICRKQCSLTQVAIDGVCRACHGQCAGGCFGTGPDECLACANWEDNGACVGSCQADRSYPNVATLECQACNSACNAVLGNLNGRPACASGTGPQHCAICNGVREGGVCLSNCSTGMYPDERDLSTALGGICRSCHSQCAAAGGCLGPRSDQCNTCENFYDLTVNSCVTQCPTNTYPDGRTCRKCDLACLNGCSGSGPTACRADADRLVTTARTLGCRHVAQVHSDQTVSCLLACPVGLYADADGLCQGCSPACARALGCTGMTQQDCVPCPTDQYLDSNQTCQPCSDSCQSGCTGPLPAECFACKGARHLEDCVTSCATLNTPTLSFYTDVQETESICRQCHPQCENGDAACNGSTASDCTLRCKAYTHGLTDECLDSCGSESYVSDSPRPKSCFPCDPLCSGGCRGPGPSSCNACTVALDPVSGNCVSQCPANQVATNRVCTCPADRAFVNSSGDCQPCSEECATGCTGQLPNQCKDGSQGCRVAALDGVCVGACPAGMSIQNKECVCSSGFFPDTQGCSACYPQCFGSCTGPSASQCARCRSFKLGAECVEACPAMQHPDEDNVCKPCSPTCVDGCNAPADPEQCIRCRDYQDGSACVSSCPDSKPFLDDGICMVQCPSARPYYNDTRIADSDLLSEPQLCVAVCGALRDPEKLNVASGEPYRCSTTARISADASRSSDDGSNVAIVGGVVAAVIICLLIIALVVWRCRKTRQKADIAPMTYDMSASPYDNTQNSDRVHSNAMYVPSPGRPGQVDPYAFDPQSQYAAPQHYDNSFSATEDDSYLDVSMTPANPYSMSDAALFGGDDEDEFNYTLSAGGGTDMQSTRM
eukprot:m.281668 g.281668  ORF g.281668 m.281668 type:complete len:2067 (-) comp17742_c0_seq1:2351-8551(-)